MDLSHCDFQNKWMTKPCGVKLMDDHGEPYCYIHGTRRFVERPWDINVEEAKPITENTGVIWTKEEEEKLLKMYKEGIPVVQIAEEFKRSSNSIYNKLWVLKNDINKNTE